MKKLEKSGTTIYLHKRTPIQDLMLAVDWIEERLNDRPFYAGMGATNREWAEKVREGLREIGIQS